MFCFVYANMSTVTVTYSCNSLISKQLSVCILHIQIKMFRVRLVTKRMFHRFSCVKSHMSLGRQHLLLYEVATST